MRAGNVQLRSSWITNEKRPLYQPTQSQWWHSAPAVPPRPQPSTFRFNARTSTNNIPRFTPKRIEAIPFKQISLTLQTQRPPPRIPHVQPQRTLAFTPANVQSLQTLRLRHPTQTHARQSLRLQTTPLQPFFAPKVTIAAPPPRRMSREARDFLGAMMLLCTFVLIVGIAWLAFVGTGGDDDDTVLARGLSAPLELPSRSHPPPLPPPASPPPPPYAPSAVHIVLNKSRCIVNIAGIDISFAHNHRCEDGGQGSVSKICKFGFDFPDCPPRRIIVHR